MQDCGPFIDRNGRQHDVSNADESNWCLKLSVWIRSWRQRVCYLKGSKVFFAVDWTTPPYDMINLLDPGLSITLRRYKLIFPDGRSDVWYNALLKNHFSELLYEACLCNDQSAIANLLLQERTDVNYRRDEFKRQTPLHNACINGHADVANKLIEKGAQVNLVDEEFNSPLYLASREGHAKTVKTLLASKVWVNQTNQNNETALFAAVEKGHGDVVTLLLNAGASIAIKEYRHARTCFDIASPSLKETLQAHTGGIFKDPRALNQQSHQRLFDQLKEWSDTTEEVKKVLWEKFNEIDLNAPNPQEQNAFALNQALQRGHKALIKFLIHCGADVNNCDPLTLASPLNSCTDGETARLLIQFGANVNHVNKGGSSELSNAVHYKRKDVIKALIDGGADVNLVLGEGENTRFALHSVCSATEEMVDVLQWFIDAEVDVNSITMNKTPLQEAAEQGHVETVKLLILAGASLEHRYYSGETALHMAAKNGHRRMVALLLKTFGVDINEQKTDGYTALHLASEKGHFKVVRLLLRKGADVTLLADTYCGYKSLKTAQQLAKTTKIAALFEKPLKPKSPRPVPKPTATTVLTLTSKEVDRKLFMVGEEGVLFWINSEEYERQPVDLTAVLDAGQRDALLKPKYKNLPFEAKCEPKLGTTLYLHERNALHIVSQQGMELGTGTSAKPGDKYRREFTVREALEIRDFRREKNVIRGVYKGYLEYDFLDILSVAQFTALTWFKDCRFIVTLKAGKKVFLYVEEAKLFIGPRGQLIANYHGNEELKDYCSDDEESEDEF